MLAMRTPNEDKYWWTELIRETSPARVYVPPSARDEEISKYVGYSLLVPAEFFLL